MPLSLMVSFVILVIGIIGILIFYIKSRPKSEQPVQKPLFPVQRIENGIIYTDNECLRLFKVNSVNYYLLSEAEQQSFEYALMGALRAIEFPLEFFSYMKTIDLRETVHHLEEAATQLKSPVQKQYADNLASALNGIFKHRSYRTADVYLTISADNRDELETRSMLVASVFEQARVTLVPLASDELIDVLHEILNRQSFFRPSIAVANGGLEDIAYGKGLVFDAK